MMNETALQYPEGEEAMMVGVSNPEEKIQYYSFGLPEEEKHKKHFSPILFNMILKIFCGCNEWGFRKYRNVKDLGRWPELKCVLCAAQISGVSLEKMDSDGYFINENPHDHNDRTLSIGDFTPAIPTGYGGYHLSYTCPESSMENWKNLIVIYKFKLGTKDYRELIPFLPKHTNEWLFQ